MSTIKSLLEQEDIQYSPATVFFSLRDSIDDIEILEEICKHIDFKNNEVFFESVKKFLIDYGKKMSLGDAELMVKQIKEAQTSDADAFKRAQESIIMTINRPAFLINNDDIDDTIETTWKERIYENKEKICDTIPSVGRIEILGHPNYPWVGTGWLIKGTNIIVTNRHVIEKFVDIEDSDFIIRKNSKGIPLEIKIDFKEELDCKEEREFRIEKILHVSKYDEPDIALLQVESQNEKNQFLPEGLEIFDDTVQPNDNVFVVGYPANSESKIHLYDFIFNGISEVKRLAPGDIFPSSAASYIYEHDCSTWYGNSGSPVIDFYSGKVVGVHYSGSHHHFGGVLSNWAVRSTYLLRLLEELSLIEKR